MHDLLNVFSEVDDEGFGEDLMIKEGRPGADFLSLADSPSLAGDGNSSAGKRQGTLGQAGACLEQQCPIRPCKTQQ